MNFPKTDSYSPALLRENMMGPNSMRILEELLAQFPLEPCGATPASPATPRKAPMTP